jgi:hypothetical protein
MTTEEKFTIRGPSPSDKPSTTSITPAGGGEPVKGIEGEAPLPDDEPQREDEDLSGLLQNTAANQKPSDPKP